MTALAATAEGLADLVRRGAAVSRPEPAWRSRRRLAAAEWIAVNGFPTQKHEDWRYFPLRDVLGDPFELAEEGTPDVDGARDLLEAVSLGLGASRLVFVNGRFAPRLSQRGRLPSGARLSDAGAALGAAPGATSGAPTGPASGWSGAAHRHAFAALNLALSVDGAVLELPPGAVVEEPIELVFLTVAGGRRLLTSPRSVLHLGEGSRATVLETHAGAPGASHLSVPVTEVRLEDGAELEHYRLQIEPDDALHLSSVEVRQGAHSRVCSHLLAFGSRVARHEVAVHLGGEGAEVSLDGLSLVRDDQLHDHPILVEHVARRCVSRQRYVGVVDGRGRGVFNGHVVVRPGADETDASQSNANLLLSEQGEVDTRPRLEIFADDVACTHGAAVGRLDADVLFYLRSRGIPEPLARMVLVQGFTGEMTERIELPPLRSRVDELIAGRLRNGGHAGVTAPFAVPDRPVGKEGEA